MWKKDEEPAAGPATARPSTPQRSQSSEGAKIGGSIRIRGEVEGDEDLLIEGEIDGSVDLKQNAVTVGRGGQVRANINGRIVTVDGTVTGNLTADEQVVLRGSAQVEGDITAPRVVLEDGATFRGGVDMGTHTASGASASKSKAPEEEKASNADAREGSHESSGTDAGKNARSTGSDSSSSARQTASAGKDADSTKATAKAGS